MKVIKAEIALKTKGATDLIDITDKVEAALGKAGLAQGIVVVFVVGSTAAITTFEYEPGLISDMKAQYEKLAPCGQHYAHDATWGDANGFSHVRSALQGPSLTIPFSSGKLILGTWQQIVLAEFDNRPRSRKVILQFMGSG